MKLTGKLNIFVSTRGKGKFYNTNISRELENNTHTSVSVDVEFGKENFPKEKLDKLVEDKCYQLDVTNAWLSAREYQDKSGITIHKPVIFITEAKCIKVTDCKPKAQATETPDLL